MRSTTPESGKLHMSSLIICTLTSKFLQECSGFGVKLSDCTLTSKFLLQEFSRFEVNVLILPFDPTEMSGALKVVQRLYNFSLLRSSSLARPWSFCSGYLPPSISTTLTSRVALLAPLRGYKDRSSLKLMCSGCRFVRRKGRLRVVCTKKQRHKQRQA